MLWPFVYNIYNISISSTLMHYISRFLLMVLFRVQCLLEEIQCFGALLKALWILYKCKPASHAGHTSLTDLNQTPFQ